jgi:hypothetical protein
MAMHLHTLPSWHSARLDPLACLPTTWSCQRSAGMQGLSLQRRGLALATLDSALNDFGTEAK